MIDPNLIKRINELSAIARVRDLTDEEIKEREELRKEYRKQFLDGFKQTLDGVKVVDENGNEVDIKKGNA